jgi:vancomycin resistance protein YoaR
MTSIGEQLAPSVEPGDLLGPAPGGMSEAGSATTSVVPARIRVWPRLVVSFAVGLLLCLSLAAAALVAWDAGYEGRVLPGVSVGGVDLSGLDRAQATAALQASYGSMAEGRIVLRTTAEDAAVPFAAFSRRPDVQALVEAALVTGRAGGPLERAVGQVRLATTGTSLSPLVVLDADALTASVRATLARLDRPAVDGRIFIAGNGMLVWTAAADGRRFDASAATAASLAAVSRIDAPNEVVIPVGVEVIPPRIGDDDTMAAEAAFDRMRKKVVVELGERHWTMKASKVGTWLRIGTTADGRPWPEADTAAIAKTLKRVGKAVRRDPVSAQYLKTRGGRVVGVVAARNGRKLDRPATAAAIAETLALRGHGTKAGRVALEMTKLKPKRSTAAALEKGPQMYRLGVWKTWFPVSERNSFGANIWLPAKFIDGTVLMPGQRFEWWRAIGPVTPARGFGLGGFIAGDHTEPTGALGGGMCSSSTTLFNAALRAGLQMGARDNHRYYIDRYPLGLDATVSKTRGGAVQTVTFTNDMRDPIVIRTFRYTSGGRGWVRYEIWGIPDGRKVSISRAAVSNVSKAITRTVYVSNLPSGQREQIEYPANGMDVSVTRVVRSEGGRVLHRNTYRTHYTLWNGLVHVGK